MNAEKTKTKINVQIEVEYEIDPLKKFQAAGHFVPAMREREADGAATMQPRKWRGIFGLRKTAITPLIGAKVHALTLSTQEGKQVARSIADSRAECEVLLAEQIRNQFFADIRALEIVSFNADQARRVKDERDRLVNWMIAHAPVNELAKALGIAEAAVEAYLAKEAALRADPTPITNIANALPTGAM